MSKATLEGAGSQHQAWLVRRFQGMGLDPKPLPGGRCLAIDLELKPEPLETLDTPRVLRALRFVTVGIDRIKCVAPRVLFYLPLIRIGDCHTRGDLEARIRSVWTERLETLRRTRDWLGELGVECESPRATPQWVFRLGLEDKHARAAVVEPHRIILPSTGPLSGIPLERLEDRLFRPDPSCASAVDLEIAVTTRLQELARYAQRTREQKRGRAADDPHGVLEVLKRTPPLLVVGPHLAGERAFHDSLRVRGFEVTSARSIDEAVARFSERSFELVLAETRLDRADGIELIPALRGVAGIEEVPVVLLDDRPRDSRRSAARAAGAAGYVARPLVLPRLSVALARLLHSPRRRRFTRYRRALSVAWDGGRPAGVTQNIGRGGMLLRGEELPGEGPIRCEIHLPELGAGLRVDATVVHRFEQAGRPSVGVQFHRFPDRNERIWIDFLNGLEPRPAPA